MFCKRGGIKTFRSKFCVSQYRKISLGKNSVYQKISGNEKFFCMRRGYHDFLSKIFCFTVPKNFVEEPFRVSKKFCYRKFSCVGGGQQGFVKIFLSHRTEKLRKGSLLCFRIFLVWKKFMDKR